MADTITIVVAIHYRIVDVGGQRERSGYIVLKMSQLSSFFVALSAYDLGRREEQAIVSERERCSGRRRGADRDDGERESLVEGGRESVRERGEGERERER